MLRNSEGRRVPQVTFRTRKDGRWADVTTDQVFEGRTVVVFALPGAYTPTCSSTHLPRYNELAPTLKRAGVDEIVCLSVNDAFVMSEWQAAQDAPNVSPTGTTCAAREPAAASPADSRERGRAPGPRSGR